MEHHYTPKELETIQLEIENSLLDKIIGGTFSSRSINQNNVSTPEELRRLLKLPKYLTRLSSFINSHVSMAGAPLALVAASVRGISKLREAGNLSYIGNPIADNLLLEGTAIGHIMASLARITYGINKGQPFSTLSGLTAVTFASLEALKATTHLVAPHSHLLGEKLIEKAIPFLIGHTVGFVGVGYANGALADRAEYEGGEVPDYIFGGEFLRKKREAIASKWPDNEIAQFFINKKIWNIARKKDFSAFINPEAWAALIQPQTKGDRALAAKELSEVVAHVFKSYLMCYHDLFMGAPGFVGKELLKYGKSKDLKELTTNIFLKRDWRYAAAGAFFGLELAHVGINPLMLNHDQLSAIQLSAAISMNLSHVINGIKYIQNGAKAEGAAELFGGVFRGWAETFLHDSNPLIANAGSMFYQAGKAGTDGKAILAQVFKNKEPRTIWSDVSEMFRGLTSKKD